MKRFLSLLVLPFLAFVVLVSPTAAHAETRVQPTSYEFVPL